MNNIYVLHSGLFIIISHCSFYVAHCFVSCTILCEMKIEDAGAVHSSADFKLKLII